MTICPACKADVHPKTVFAFGEHGPQKCCPNPECNAVIAEPETAPEPAQAAKAPRGRKPKRNDADAPLDVLKAAKKRLRYVTRERKRLAKELKTFETEETKLTRLLKAAESPVAGVTPLRKAGN